MKKRKAATHRRNRYAEATPDFASLASRYPSLAPAVAAAEAASTGQTTPPRESSPELSWTTTTAFAADGQLCPAVTNRANYILWIEDLLQEFPAPWKKDEEQVAGLDMETCKRKQQEHEHEQGQVVGLDIGTGAITDVAAEFGKKNIDANPHLAGLIELRSAAREVGEDKDKLIVGVVKDEERFDFSMSNPPFFESMDEAGRNPRTACGGTVQEMVCEGGEAGFVSRMVRESVEVGTRIHWFTSMLGKKSSLKTIKAEIRSCGATMLKTTEFVQGKTWRWGIAWTFSSDASKRRKKISLDPSSSGGFSFVLDGIDRRCSAVEVLKCLAAHLEENGVVCEVDEAGFAITGKREETIEFKVTLFQQCPGCLLVKSWVSEAGRGNDALMVALGGSESALKEKVAFKKS